MHICNISAAAYPVHVWGARDQACVHLCSFHHYEPWLCWAHWAARQLESSVSSYCHDGARLWWADLSVPSVLIISGSGIGGSNFGVNQSKNSVVNLMHLWMTEVISRKGLLSTLLFIYWQFVIQQTEGMYLIQIPFEDPLTYYLVLSKHTFFLYLFRTYCGGDPIFRRLWVLQEFGPEDGADVQTVLRAAVSARPLWLWNAGGQVCAGDGRFSETTKPWQIRGCGIDSST